MNKAEVRYSVSRKSFRITSASGGGERAEYQMDKITRFVGKPLVEYSLTANDGGGKRIVAAVDMVNGCLWLREVDSVETGSSGICRKYHFDKYDCGPGTDEIAIEAEKIPDAVIAKCYYNFIKLLKASPFICRGIVRFAMGFVMINVIIGLAVQATKESDDGSLFGFSVHKFLSDQLTIWNEEVAHRMLIAILFNGLIYWAFGFYSSGFVSAKVKVA